MRKNLLFISAILTVFVTALLGGVARAYTALKPSNPPVQPTVFLAPQTAESPTFSVQVQSVSPQAAAAIAAKVLGRTDLYSVELTDFNSAQVYKVTFTAGHVAYVSLTGEVLSVVLPQPAAVVASPQSQGQAVGSSHHGGGDENEGGDD